MAEHQTYDEQKKMVFHGLIRLGIITIIEVVIALLAKGHLIPGVDFKHGFGHYFYMALMVGFSLYKAYFIIYFFMHMAYEVRGMALSVLLPTTLLIWAVIAFFQEGNYWKNSRQEIQYKNEQGREENVAPAPGGQPQGYMLPNTFDRHHG